MHHCAANRLDFDGLLASARRLHAEEVAAHCYFPD
jgi:hypothetical protein